MFGNYYSDYYRNPKVCGTKREDEDGVAGMPKAMMLERRDIDTRDKRGRYTACVLGCKRAGLTQACLFAEAGFRVIYVDVDHNLVNPIEAGKIVFAEPKLSKLLGKHMKNGRLTVEYDIRKAASSSQILLLCVPATVDKNGKPDYSYMMKACRKAGLTMHPGCIVICTSTMRPGVTESLVKETLEKASGLKAGRDFGLAYSPTSTISARVLQDVYKHRRRIGAINERSLISAHVVLDTVTKGKIVEVRDVKTAETAELLERIYGAVNIALANELAGFCEEAGIDFIEAQKAASANPHSNLSPPQLVGGYVMAGLHLLNDEAEALNTRLRMLTLAGRINEGMVGHTVHLVNDALRACGKNLRRAKILVFGVSSHPNSRETEGSLVKKLVDALKRRGGHVWVYDSLFSHKELVEMGYRTEMTLTKVVEKADCLVIAVGHDRFSRLNFRKIKLLMKKPAAIVDMGRVIDPERAEKEGFTYCGVGRGILTSSSLS
ncbi:MAG: nucleotide sugar dehydrogenase [Candidatus Bathyarchaeota archaeon]|nr:MAG: nucleotide sugar dehydrogenase [Candidatus Bathyarchaeota archaeon]